MHAGEFPNGVELATFVMTRYSYPLERMSMEDYRMFAGQATLAAAPLQGKWEGALILQPRANTLLLSPPAPVRFQFDGGFRVGLERVAGVAWTELSGTPSELRMLDANTAAGTWSASPQLLNVLRWYVEEASTFSFVLERELS